MREKTHKRLTAALLMMIMLSAVLPVQAFAAEDSSTRYELGEDSLVNTGKDTVIPRKTNLIKMIHIGTGSWANFMSAVIPDRLRTMMEILCS